MKDTSLTHPPQYDVCYYIPKSCRWHIHEKVDWATVEIMAELLLELGREFKVRHRITEMIVHAQNAEEWRALHLNLFSNRITDRCGTDTD